MREIFSYWANNNNKTYEEMSGEDKKSILTVIDTRNEKGGYKSPDWFISADEAKLAEPKYCEQVHSNLAPSYGRGYSIQSKPEKSEEDVAETLEEAEEANP